MKNKRIIKTNKVSKNDILIFNKIKTDLSRMIFNNELLRTLIKVTVNASTIKIIYFVNSNQQNIINVKLNKILFYSTIMYEQNCLCLTIRKNIINMINLNGYDNVIYKIYDDLVYSFKDTPLEFKAKLKTFIKE